MVQYVASIMNLYKITALGASEQCFQLKPEIKRDMSFTRSLDRLTNVLDLGGN